MEGITLGARLPDTVCPHCGRSLKQVVMGGDNITFLTQRYERCGCPVSEAEHLKKETVARQLQQEENERRNRERVARLRARSGIRPKYRDKSFSNFTITPENKAAFNLVRTYTKKFDQLAEAGKGLFISGGCGVGKTHLATAAALELIEQEHLVICMTGVEMLAKLKQSYDDRNNLSEYEILREFLAAELLIIDDLGKENITEWSLSMLYSMVNMRIGDLKPLIVTTNYTDDQLITRLSRSGDAMTAQSIVSRLHEVCFGVEMSGPDYRSSQGNRK